MMGQQKKMLSLLFISMILVPVLGRDKDDCDCRKGYTAAAVGGLGLLTAVVSGVALIGFGPAGIVAGSYAASMMSAATTYGVGAGVVAAGQAAGAAGIAAGTKGLIVGTGAVTGYAASGGCDCPC